MYYVSDGVYGSFNCILYDHVTPTPALLEVGVCGGGRKRGRREERGIERARVHKNRRLEEERVTPIEAHSPVKIIKLY